MKHARLLIAGTFTEGIRNDEIHSPYDGRVVGAAAAAGLEHMIAAVEAAERAAGSVARLPAHRRHDILAGIARRIEAHAEELARLITAESGKPIRFSRGEVRRAVVTFELGAALTREAEGEVLPADIEPRSEGRLCVWRRVPRGPVAAIAPFNFPLNLVAHKLSPAWAAGCPVVLKPAPQTPLTAARLAELALDAGLPPEALSVLHCDPDVAEFMVRDPRMKVLSFTGSAAVGWKLRHLADRKQVLLELGGNAPCIVERDADLDRAVERISMGAWANAGQVCIKAQRIYVQRSVFDEFLERFVDATAKVAVGDPMHEDTVVGPLISAEHVERVLAWIDEARAMGATVHCGGTASGNLVVPTVLTGVSHEARVCREEVFGPVTIVEPFDAFDDAVRLCNDTRYGLQAGVFTRDLDRVLRAWRDLDYGGVIVGDVPTFRVDNFPYGGTKDSGLGREGVRFAFEEMTEPRVLVLRMPA